MSWVACHRGPFLFHAFIHCSVLPLHHHDNYTQKHKSLFLQGQTLYFSPSSIGRTRQKVFFMNDELKWKENFECSFLLFVFLTLTVFLSSKLIWSFVYNYIMVPSIPIKRCCFIKPLSKEYKKGGCFVAPSFLMSEYF